MGEKSYRLELGKGVAPPARVTERRLGIGMACRDDVVAIFTGKLGTGWSLGDGQRRWRTSLPKRYRYRGKPVVKGIGIHCDALRVRGGRARVPSGRKNHTYVRVSNGKIDGR